MTGLSAQTKETHLVPRDHPFETEQSLITAIFPKATSVKKFGQKLGWRG